MHSGNYIHIYACMPVSRYCKNECISKDPAIEINSQYFIYIGFIKKVLIFFIFLGLSVWNLSLHKN